MILVQPGFQIFLNLKTKWKGNGVDKPEKRKFVESLNSAFRHAGCVVVARYAGINAAQMEDLRTRMRQAGGLVKIAKNRLVKIAIQGTNSENISDLFKGQTLIAYSEDPVVAAKVICDFANRNNHLSIIGGAMGARVLDIESLKSLASLPSLNELRASVLGLLLAPASKIAGVIQAPASCLARVLGAHVSKNSELMTSPL